MSTDLQEVAGKGSDEEGLAQGNRETATGTRKQTGTLQGGGAVLKSCSAEGFSWASDADGSEPCGEDVCPVKRRLTERQVLMDY